MQIPGQSATPDRLGRSGRRLWAGRAHDNTGPADPYAASFYSHPHGCRDGGVNRTSAQCHPHGCRDGGVNRTSAQRRPQQGPTGAGNAWWRRWTDCF